MLLAGAILLAAFLLYTAFSVTKGFFILVLYVSCFEVSDYLVHFPGLPLLYDWRIAYALLALLLFYWIIHLLREGTGIQWKHMDTAVIIFFSVVLFGIIQGFLRGYDPKIIFIDASSLPFYGVYFVFLFSALRNKIGLFYNFLLFCAIIVSLQFFYAVVQTKSIFVLQRIVSRHIHLAQFAVPYILTTLIYGASHRHKIIFAILLPFPILAVIFSQQRAMYASIALTLLFYICLFAYTRRAWIRKNLAKFGSIIAGTLVLTATVFIIAQIVTQGRFLLTLYARFYVFLNIQYLGFDISWQIRWREIQRILENLGSFWLFGEGFGAATTSRSRFEMQLTVDNSFAYLLWKSGITGLLTFLYMYFAFLKRGFTALRKKISSQDKVFIITALANTIGLMLVGMTNSSIAHYRLILVWASLFACTEIIARRYD
jgi:hypothetical protein